MIPKTPAERLYEEKYNLLRADFNRVLGLIQDAYIAGRNDEKSNNRPPYIKIQNGWEEFKKQNKI